MIIIAIPKSASTSLMLTLGKYHRMKAKQDFSFSENQIPEKCEILYRLHSDVRELRDRDVTRLAVPNRVYKQHIYPSPNNIAKLSKVKKVVLLRPADEIIPAYKRGAIKLDYSLLPGYDLDMSDQQWLEKSKTDGLFSDLLYFNNGWKEKAQPDYTLFVDYQDYLHKPQEVTNKIEEFFGLPITQTEIKTVKARYSKQNRGIQLISNSANKFVNFLLKVKRRLGIKDATKYLRTRKERG